MSEEGLKDYYEQELRYLRELGREFAQRHGEVAGGLRMEAGQWADPHVERLMQGFAFLAARIHRRLDDDFAKICEALLNVIYPHFLRPIPSLSVVQLELDPDQGITSGLEVEAGQSLVSPPTKEGGIRCRFRTAYPVTLWPLRVTDASWQTPHGLGLGGQARESAACLSLKLEALGGHEFSDLQIHGLRFYLDGDLHFTSTLFELLDNNCTEILVRRGDDDGSPTLRLPSTALEPVGFEADEGLLPLPRSSFLGFRLIQDYFAFPQKFMFFRLSGLERLSRADLGTSAEILFLIRRFEGSERQDILERGVNRDTIRLGCTPVVNLFSSESEPIRLDHKTSDYLIRAKGAAREFSPQVFSIDDMEAVVGSRPQRVPLDPFFSFRRRDRSGGFPVFWVPRRFPSEWLKEEDATDVRVSFVDPAGGTIYPDFPSASARLTCFNGDLPTKLGIGSDRDFHPEGGEGSALTRITSLMHPTPPVHPPTGPKNYWQLVSQFSLNYLSIVDEGTAALREVLSLYNFGDRDVGEKHIRGIANVSSQPWSAPVHGEGGLSFARGRKITIDFEEDNFSGGGIYLFASVLERFLALYANLNSFTKLEARVRSKNRVFPLREWHPRAGLKPLL